MVDADAKASKRLLAIGMDGFEQTIADELMAAGRMPQLQRMLGEGRV